MMKFVVYVAVTEQEVIAGILLAKPNGSDALCITRELESLEQQLDSDCAKRFMGTPFLFLTYKVL